MPSKRIGQTPNKTTTLSTDIFAIERSNSLNHIFQSDLMVDVSTYLLAETKSIVSKTYAQWEVIRAASELGAYIDKLVFVSDKSVYLTAIAVNQFGMSGFWKNTVSSVDYYNECGFDFIYTTGGATGRFIYITDKHGNTVYNKLQSNANTTAFSFNIANNKIVGNTINANSLISNFSIYEFIGNTISNDFNIDLSASSVSGTVNYCNLADNGRLAMTSCEGSFLSSTIKKADVDASLDTGITIDQCSFLDNITVALDPTVSYTGKTVKRGFSNFNKTITQTGLTTLTNSATYGAHIGIFNITSTNATETINLFANAPENHPFRIYPESGLTITLTHATGANQPICAGGISAVLNGTNGDWIEFTYNDIANRYYQTNGETY